MNRLAMVGTADEAAFALIGRHTTSYVGAVYLYDGKWLWHLEDDSGQRYAKGTESALHLAYRAASDAYQQMAVTV